MPRAFIASVLLSLLFVQFVDDFGIFLVERGLRIFLVERGLRTRFSNRTYITPTRPEAAFRPWLRLPL